jgi:hypothetical protein
MIKPRMQVKRVFWRQVTELLGKEEKE